ncbi:hypothetical protein [Alicyclobacillus sp. SO9]|uniref:hypothetical protein n=1 Tax=Alicyclobacillus sp. SO9 TaxID=2665646 RepID=UPI0018E74451|nr:hypothetical protein [Alicyclobacillus sp. SO9]QQE80908.1 hypothetical protein GI364_11285 [Alicyclobacillus sp. SO9]
MSDLTPRQRGSAIITAAKTRMLDNEGLMIVDTTEQLKLHRALEESCTLLNKLRDPMIDETGTGWIDDFFSRHREVIAK